MMDKFWQGSKLTLEQINKSYEQWQYQLGCLDYDGRVVTRERLEAWSNNPDKKLMCLFCGVRATENNSFIFCLNCKSYKGIIPDLSEY